MGARKKGRTKEGWSKETFLREMREEGASAIGVCAKYAVTCQPETLYKNDVLKWKKRDPDFAREYVAIQGRDPSKLTRKRVDLFPDKYAGWKIDLCQALLDNNGNLSAAVKDYEGCPYSFSTLRSMLRPSHANYDAELHEMVRTIELKVCEELKGGMVEDWKALDPGKSRAWVADRYLQAMDPRFSKKLNIKAEVAHQHQHGITKPLEERLEALADSWAEFREKHSEQPSLPSGEDVREMVIDAEIVDEGSEAQSR